MKKTLLCAGILAASSIFVNSAEADVVTSIKPLGFIAASIADGVTDTKVLVEGNQSPHTFALTPKVLETAKNADLLVYISPNLEISLGKALENKRLAPKHVLELGEQEEIEHRLVESYHHDHDEDGEDDDHDHDHHHDHGHDHHGHDHDDDEDDHDHDHDHDHEHHHDHDHDHNNAAIKGIGFEDANPELETNYHIWTSPVLAKEIASSIAEELVEIYPAKEALIKANLTKFNNGLDLTVKKIKETLKPEALNNYYVYHDAYYYFESDFGFRDHNKGAIYFNISVDPSAKQLHDLHKQSHVDNIKVIFSEPQFNQKIAAKLARSTHSTVGILDPLGSNLEVKPGAYESYLLQLAAQFNYAKKK